MDKNLLIRLITTSPKVILPGFGAFLHKSKESHPVFTPFLRTDDGYLTAQVAQEYGIEVDDAKEMVAAFIEHIKATIEKNNQFYFDGVGTLRVDVNGAITFLMDTSKQIPSEAKAVTEVTPTPQPIPQPTPTPQVEPAPMPRTEHTFATPQKPIFTTQPPRPAQQSQPIAPRPIAPQPIVKSAPQVQFPQARAQAPTPERVVPTQTHQQPLRPNNMQNPQRPINNQNSNRPQDNHSGQRANNSAQPKRPDPNKQLRQSPAPPRKNKKGDVWLLIAIIAAVIVIGLMVYGILTAQQTEML